MHRWQWRRHQLGQWRRHQLGSVSDPLPSIHGIALHARRFARSWCCLNLVSYGHDTWKIY